MASVIEPKSTNSSSTITRYRNLIISIAVFIALISVLMGFSIFSSSYIAQHTVQINVAAKMRDLTQSINQNLFNLKLSYGEDPSSPHIAYTLKSLTTNKADLEQGLNALLNGGTTTDDAGNTLTVLPLKHADEIGYIQSAQKLWRPLAQQIDVYLSEANSPLADATSLDRAVTLVQGSNVNLYGNIEAAASSMERETREQARLMQIGQMIGIAIAILYFIVFIFYFMRKLRLSDAEADQARNETTEIMNTVNSGLFLLDKEMNIGSQYSKELERLIGQREVGGKSLISILNDKISTEDLDTTSSFVAQLYNPRVKERLIGSLNPLARIPMRIADLKTGESNIRYLDFKFNRVYQNKNITRVLVNVSDETHAVLLEKKIEQEREQNDIQLEMLSTLLKSDSLLINSFVKNTKRHTIEINNILKRPGENQIELREKANAIFREVHSLKGEASALSLHGFTVQAEALEVELKRLQGMAVLSGEDFLSLAVSLENLMSLTQTIEGLTRRLGNENGNTVLVSKTPIKDYYTQFVSDLATRNNKKVDFACIGVDEVGNEQFQTSIREIFIQLLRNSVVHGIEKAEDRQAKRKLGSGHIHMELTETAENYTLLLADDGGGINYQAIRNKAVQNGLYTEEDAAELNQKQLLNLLFSSGFSTLDVATEDGGRGVGLDIIKDRIAAMKGSIKVATASGAYTQFILTLPKRAFSAS